MCTVLLPPGDNPIAVNKYINYQLTVMSVPFTVRCNENVNLEPGIAILIDWEHFTIEVPLNLSILFTNFVDHTVCYN
jgi:hypothetical protein